MDHGGILRTRTQETVTRLSSIWSEVGVTPQESEAKIAKQQAAIKNVYDKALQQWSNERENCVQRIENLKETIQMTCSDMRCSYEELTREVTHMEQTRSPNAPKGDIRIAGERAKISASEAHRP